jgi:MerR family transcriptional regulator, thiopeptide resistance regulator
MYTVRQLSKLAGITPRTLHYYDEIGLLKPSRIGDNGYRYYGEESLLRLQQILFYRALDMPLAEIKKTMGRRDFDIRAALESHKVELRKRLARMERLIISVDQTLLHLKGQKEMSQKQFFEAFSAEQQAEYEQEAQRRYDPATVTAASGRWKGYTATEKQRIQDEGQALYQDLAGAMLHGAASAEAQAGVDRWRRHIGYFWTPQDDQLLGLADLYNEDPRFKANFDRVDPGLAEFLRAAVKVYVDRRKK